MSADSIMFYVLIVWLAALFVLLLRLFQLRLHQRIPLFTISTAFEIVFGATTVYLGLNAAGLANLGLLGDTMDLFLTPFIAFELFAARPDNDRSSKFIGPAAVTLGAAATVVAFLMSSPGGDSIEAAEGLAFLADTVMTVVVIWYALRKMAGSSAAPGRNLLWIRRLFLVELVSSALRSIIEPLFASTHFNMLDIAFFAVSVIATALCTFALRKTSEPSVPA
jgi:hypothetical protein